jgi:hypothetical protein
MQNISVLAEKKSNYKKKILEKNVNQHLVLIIGHL